MPSVWLVEPDRPLVVPQPEVPRGCRRRFDRGVAAVIAAWPMWPTFVGFAVSGVLFVVGIVLAVTDERV